MRASSTVAHHSLEQRIFRHLTTAHTKTLNAPNSAQWNRRYNSRTDDHFRFLMRWKSKKQINIHTARHERQNITLEQRTGFMNAIEKKYSHFFVVAFKKKKGKKRINIQPSIIILCWTEGLLCAARTLIFSFFLRSFIWISGMFYGFCECKLETGFRSAAAQLPAKQSILFCI